MRFNPKETVCIVMKENMESYTNDYYIIDEIGNPSDIHYTLKCRRTKNNLIFYFKYSDIQFIVNELKISEDKDVKDKEETSDKNIYKSENTIYKVIYDLNDDNK